MGWKKVVWSPVEVDYLKIHKDEPLMQLCIALSKSRAAVNNKLAELGNKGTTKVLPGHGGLRSRIGKRKDCNNQFFRSSWEANVYRLLKSSLEEKNIDLIQYEPTDFTFWQFGIKKGTVSYTPDFKITYKDGTYSWIEVKGGFLKGQDKTKIKRFKKFYPEEAAHLVCVVPGPTAKTTVFFKSEGIPVLWHYPEINKKYKKLVSNWE